MGHEQWLAFCFEGGSVARAKGRGKGGPAGASAWRREKEERGA
jgi:hypothetical protein